MTGVGLGRCGTAWVLLVALVADASASLSVIGTRFIYPAGVSALTIRVGNVGTRPALVQTWLDRGDETADPSAVTVPFILSPPLLRMTRRRPRRSSFAIPASRCRTTGNRCSGSTCWRCRGGRTAAATCCW